MKLTFLINLCVIVNTAASQYADDPSNDMSLLQTQIAVQSTQKLAEGKTAMDSVHVSQHAARAGTKGSEREAFEVYKGPKDTNAQQVPATGKDSPAPAKDAKDEGYARGHNGGDRGTMPMTDEEQLLTGPMTAISSQEAQGLTLVVMDYSRKRWKELGYILQHYQSFDRSLIEEIVVAWNDHSDRKAPQELQAMNEINKVPIRVEVFMRNSMNNRYAVGEKIKTQGVVVQDNDMYISQEDFSCLVKAWRQQPNRLIGAWSQARAYKKDYSYVYGNMAGSYCILLPHPWVVKTEYLRLYMNNKPMLDLVDDLTNCDDIYFNAVVANQTGFPSFAYNVLVHKFPSAENGISSKSSWTRNRGECLKRINAFFQTDIFQWAHGSQTCESNL